jgi:hypothetical protein
MSAKVFKTPGKIVPQPDFQASQMENGGWRGSQSFMVALGDSDSPVVRSNFAVGTRATDLDPNNEAIWSFLRLKSVSVMATIGGFRLLMAEFQGFWEGDGAPSTAPEEIYPTFSLRGANRSEPIQSHPKFKALSLNERLALGKLISGEYAWGDDPFSPGDKTTYRPGDPPSVVDPDPIVSADAIKFAERIAEGVTTYERASYEWWQRWDSNVQLTTTQLNSLGKITSPPGFPPDPGGTRDWLMISANQEQSGSGLEGPNGPTYSLEIGFLLSDEGGHDDFLYT